MNRRATHLAWLLVAGLIGGVAPAGAQDVQERTIRFGHLNNPDHPVSAGVKKFAELVAAKSGGKMTVKEFPSMQLGSEMQQQSALQGGVQEMSAPAPTSSRTRQRLRPLGFPVCRQHVSAGRCLG